MLRALKMKMKWLPLLFALASPVWAQVDAVDPDVKPSDDDDALDEHLLEETPDGIEQRRPEHVGAHDDGAPSATL